jgi:alpha-beta hydrolase superfamily lysophospholipase
MNEVRRSHRLARASIRWTIRAVVLLFALALLLAGGFAVLTRMRLPELSPWHRDTLTSEFHADAADAPRTFADYMALEERLFAELRQQAAGWPADLMQGRTCRYNATTVPGRLAAGPHNRSHERVPATVKGSVLLVHGLSDSPYSMLALEQFFFDQGLHVLSLRLPGHGTMPSGLLRATWQDWYAAVELAARHLASKEDGKPFYACGYSTGAALLTLLSVRSLQDSTLPRPQRLVLLSAAIGVSEFAALANVTSAFSFVPYFERAAWLEVLPEYDPFKYNSFPVAAGNQIYRLTKQLRVERDRAMESATWTAMPKVLAFQSVVDATVSASDVVHEFCIHLRGEGHELVAFDVNRNEYWSDLLATGPLDALAAIRASGPLPFRMTMVANTAPDTNAVALYSTAAGASGVQKEELGLAWPRGVFSLGHVALPFEADDPVYGVSPRDDGTPRWNLGIAARGEAGAILVPMSTLARLRCNPLFAVIRRKLTEALAVDLGR